MAGLIQEKPALLLIPLQPPVLGIAEHIYRLPGVLSWRNVYTANAIPRVEEKTALSLPKSQFKAVAWAVNGKVTMITGGPGVREHFDKG